MATRMNFEHILTYLKKGVLLLVLIAFVINSSGCYALFDEGVEIEEKSEKIDFVINSETILEALSNGNTDVFSINQEITPSPRPPLLEGPVLWKSTDFFRVAEILHDKLWEEPLGVANMYHMAYKVDCSHIEQRGFDQALFLSFQIIDTRHEEARIEKSILILPSSNLVQTWKSEYYPNIKTKKAIDLLSFSISAEEALQIAEKNGGGKKRMGNTNDCQVSVVAPGPEGNEWRVLYQNYQDSIWMLFFEIAINPLTGDFTVIHTDQ